MEEKKLGSKPAFPNTCEIAGMNSNYQQLITDGISIRLYLAGMAMQGICADPGCADPKFIAKLALECADELLKQESL